MTYVKCTIQYTSILYSNVLNSIRLTPPLSRYLNVLPNPHTRVEIAELEGDPTTTYINANYIRGYKLAPAVYIATQGPIHSTTGTPTHIYGPSEGLISLSRPVCSRENGSFFTISSCIHAIILPAKLQQSSSPYFENKLCM